jgi:hypothetical protein
MTALLGQTPDHVARFHHRRASGSEHFAEKTRVGLAGEPVLWRPAGDAPPPC